MTSAKLIQYLLLENKYCFNYTSIAYDQEYFYACLKKDCHINKLDSQGRICDMFATQNLYKCVCYDKKQNCFWAIKDYYCNYIYKLNYKFEEIDSFLFKDLFYDYIENISYKTTDDTLLLSSRNFIYNISKQGELLFKHDFYNDCLILAIGEIGSNFVKCCSYSEKSPVIIDMVFPNHFRESLNCLPRGHRAINVFPVSYNEDNGGLYIITVRNDQFTYLFKYEVIEVCEKKIGYTTKNKNQKYFRDDNFICINDINIF